MFCQTEEFGLDSFVPFMECFCEMNATERTFYNVVILRNILREIINYYLTQRS